MKCCGSSGGTPPPEADQRAPPPPADRPARSRSRLAWNSLSAVLLAAAFAMSIRCAKRSFGKALKRAMVSSADSVACSASGPGQLGLRKPRDQRRHRAECDEQPLPRAPAAGQRAQHRLGHLEHRRRPASAREDQRNGMRMRPHRLPQRRGNRPDLVLPLRIVDKRPARLADHRLHHQQIDVLALLHVVVERHGARAEFGGKRAHGKPCEPFPVDKGQCGGLELRMREFGGSSHGGGC